MKMTKISDVHKDGFGRGWIFRCNRAQYPYEDKVEFMIREEPDSPSAYALMVISGFKAGCTLVQLPEECLNFDKSVGRQWLIDNWSKWIYPECPVSEVSVFRNEIV